MRIHSSRRRRTSSIRRSGGSGSAHPLDDHPRRYGEEDEGGDVQVEGLMVGVQAGEAGIDDAEEQQFKADKFGFQRWQAAGRQPAESDQQGNEYHYHGSPKAKERVAQITQQSVSQGHG